MASSKHQCGLYIISPQSFVLSEFKGQLKRALEGGKVDVFQLRLKDAPDAEIIAACKELLPICHEYGTQFILNDNVHLVNEVGADGVHIGIEDMPVKAARSKLKPDKIIGVSCYDDIERAIDSAESGADYVAFGAFYDTQTKIARGRPKPDILKWWTTNSVVPCVAIGGIKPHNCLPLVEAGADFIAVVTGIWDDKDGAGEAVRKFNQVI